MAIAMLIDNPDARERLARAVTVAVALALAALLGAPAGADAGHRHRDRDRAAVLDATTWTPVRGAYSKLERSHRGIEGKVRTRGLPGHAYTLWYVIFNAPEHCSGGACGDDDIFLDPTDHSAGFNVPQIVATRAASVWAGSGDVARRSGRIRLGGSLRVGRLPGGPAQVVVGRPQDGALVPVGVAAGIENVRGAVILAVLQDHGLAHDDPALRARQLSSFQGACNPTCWEPQVAFHEPRAKRWGKGGRSILRP